MSEPLARPEPSPATPSKRRRFPGDRSRLICGGIALAGVVLRLAIALRPLDYVDRFFVPDDTYYTLNIARALAQGLGPTADGIHLTNGFQPLLAFLLVPVFWLTRDPDAGLRAAVVLLATIDGVLAFSLGEVARRAATKRPELAAILATGLWASSPLAISYALGGLETSLALLTAALLALAWSSARRSGSTQDYVRAGAVAGLAILARIDIAVLVAGLGLWELVTGNRRGALAAAAGGVVAVGPWWFYELVRFHTVIPTSGEAVHQLMKIWQADDRWPFRGSQLFGVSVGAILEAVVGRAIELRSLLTQHEVIGLVIAPLIVAAVSVGAVRLVRDAPDAVPLRALVIFGLFIWSFYVVWVPQYPYFPRYLSPMHVSLALLISLGIAHLESVGSALLPRWTPAVLAGLLVLPSVARTAGFLAQEPTHSVDTSFQGIKGYRAPVKEVLLAAPKGAVVGSLQTGALGYFAPAMRPDVRIFNLDGVVDEEAAAAFKSRHLAAFARSRGMTHFADFGFNVESFRRFSGDAHLDESSFVTVMRAQSQGSNQLRLVEIRWPVSGADPKSPSARP